MSFSTPPGKKQQPTRKSKSSPAFTDAQTKELSEIIKNTLKEILLPFEQRLQNLEDKLVSPATCDNTFDVSYLEKRINNLEDNIVENHEQIEKNINNLNNSITATHNFFELLSRKVDDNNQYARRMNLVINGIYLQRNESPDSLRQQVITELDRLGLRDAIPHVDRAHRYGSRSGKLQSVIVRFNTWHSRNLFFNKRRDCKWRLEADLTDRRRALLDNAIVKAELIPLVKYVAVDRNCSLYALSVKGKSFSFSSMMEFDMIINAIEDDCARLNQYYDFLRSKHYAPNEPDCDCNQCEQAVAKYGKWVNKATQVINLNDEFYKTESIPLRKYNNNDFVFIGRKSKWGNDFKGTDCVTKFEENLSPGLLANIHELKGKTLGCFCKPDPCHGDVLARLADGV